MKFETRHTGTGLKKASLLVLLCSVEGTEVRFVPDAQRRELQQKARVGAGD